MKKSRFFLAAGIVVLTSAFVCPGPAGANDLFDVTPVDFDEREKKSPTPKEASSGGAYATAGTITTGGATRGRSKLSMSSEVAIDEDTEPVRVDNGKKAGRMARFTALPKSIAGVTCGVMIGVPVQIVKDTKKYTVEMNKTLSGDFQCQGADLQARSMAAGASIPFGVLSGLVHGTIRGVENGLQSGTSKPFSKESMSLGENR